MQYFICGACRECEASWES